MFQQFLVLPMIVCAISSVGATEQSWSLEPGELQDFSVHGQVTSEAGVSGRSLVLDGGSMLKVKESEEFANGEPGFTLLAWVNPYSLNGSQQMLAAKNCYSLDERQWGVMIDKDNRFRLYVWQGRWETLESKVVPVPGEWHLIGVVVRPEQAELWVNGKREIGRAHV